GGVRECRWAVEVALPEALTREILVAHYTAQAAGRSHTDGAARAERMAWGRLIGWRRAGDRPFRDPKPSPHRRRPCCWLAGRCRGGESRVCLRIPAHRSAWPYQIALAGHPTGGLRGGPPLFHRLLLAALGFPDGTPWGVAADLAGDKAQALADELLRWAAAGVPKRWGAARNRRSRAARK